MKKLINTILTVSALVAISGTAQAESIDMNERLKDFVIQWMGDQQQVYEGTIVETGEACTLFIQVDADDKGTSLITVSPKTLNANPLDPNEYIGLFMRSVSSISARTRALYIKSNESWGNDSQENNILIMLDKSGKPRSVLAKSDVKEITCSLN